MRSPISSVKGRTPSGMRWRVRPAIVLGLGDKTGPLDLPGGASDRDARLRSASIRSGRSPLQKLAVPDRQDGPSAVSYGLFYDNYAEGSFDLGCERDNYFGPFRCYEAENGDLDFYLFLGPRLKDVTPKFLALTGRTALPPRWSLGFAQTAMALADAPTRRSASRASSTAAQRTRSRSARFTSARATPRSARSAMSSPGTVKNSRTRRPDAEVSREPACKVVANLKPCLLDDHPRYAEAAAAAPSSPRRRRRRR